MQVLLLGIFFLIIQANNDTYDGPIVGIDLGTTYSSVCFFKNEEVQVIENNGYISIPTVVALVNDTFLVGHEAKGQAVSNPNNTFYDIKRFLGQYFYDPIVQDVMLNVTYTIIDQNGSACIKVQKFRNESPAILDPKYIQAKVLNVLKKISESYLKQNISNVVIGVPTGFDSAQQNTTIETAKIAGLNVVKLLSEPRAAAIAYAKNYEEKEKNIMVFDFGGGTLDITVMKIKKDYFEDLTHAFEINLGGEDFEWKLVNYFIDQIYAATKVNLTENNNAKQKLKTEAQIAKETLSKEQVAQIKITNLFEGYDFICNVTRDKFEELNSKLYERVQLAIKSADDDVKKKKIKIDEVILVGGSSRIPKVQQIVEDYFKSIKIIKDKIQEEMICIGTAIYANFLTKRDQKRNMIIEINLTPISFGIEVKGDQISKIIPRLSVYPISLSKYFSTIEDYQRIVEIVIYQGEKLQTHIDDKIGQYQLQGIQIAKQGIPKIQVTFSLDQNGILFVTAIDLNTQSQKNQIVTTNLQQFPEEDLILLKIQNEMDLHLQYQKDQLLKKENDQLLLKENDQAITKLINYINDFIPTLLNSQYNNLLSQAQKDEILQLITSSSQWVQQQSKETNTKREDYEKELKNLSNLINSILPKKQEDL